MSWCKRLAFVGSERGDDVLAKTKALVSPDAPNDAASSDLIDHLYAILGILDEKASGLLSLNSFFIALLLGVLGFAYSPDSKLNASLPHNFLPAAEIDLGLLVASSIFCLFVVRINWKFLQYAQPGTGGKYDFNAEIVALAKIVDNRTHYYWIAWYGTFFSFLVPLIIWVLF